MTLALLLSLLTGCASYRVNSKIDPELVRELDRPVNSVSPDAATNRDAWLLVTEYDRIVQEANARFRKMQELFR